MGKSPPVSGQTRANPAPNNPAGSRSPGIGNRLRCRRKTLLKGPLRPQGDSGSGSHMQQDKRIKSRFSAASLTVTINRRSCLGLIRWSHQTHCLDINRYGVGLISPTPLPRGTRVSLDFNGQYITQSGVKAEVVSRKPAEEGGYRLSIRFVYCAYQEAYCRKLDNALSRIEAMYRQKTSH